MHCPLSGPSKGKKGRWFFFSFSLNLVLGDTVFGQRYHGDFLDGRDSGAGAVLDFDQSLVRSDDLYFEYNLYAKSDTGHSGRVLSP